MSNSLYLDESNGNGIFAMKSSNNAGLTNSSSPAKATANSINNIMTATTIAANAAIASTSAVATTNAQLHTSVSNEDLSQSLSEYTDADESISAPTEFLAEFLSAVMLKDYKKALKYCKLILQYEPNNATAKEFYPLILDKLREMNSSDSDENYNKSSSPEMIIDMANNECFGNESDGGVSDDQLQNDNDEQADDYGVPEDNSSREPNSNDSHSCDSVGLSLSDSVEDDEADILSSSGDDLPNDDQMRSISDEVENDEEMEKGIGLTIESNDKGFKIRNGSSSGGENRSGSDNTTHSFSSLLLEEEEEDDLAPVNLQFQKNLSAHELDISNGNKVPSASCSDSESPTEPLTQRLAAILRSKCSISSGD